MDQSTSLTIAGAVALLYLACLLPPPQVSAQQMPPETIPSGQIFIKRKVCNTTRPAEVEVLGSSPRKIDPCKYVPAATGAAVAKGSYKLFQISNQVRADKVTESAMAEQIMKYTGASEKDATSVAQKAMKRLGSGEFKALTLVGTGGGLIVAVYEFQKAWRDSNEANTRNMPDDPALKAASRPKKQPDSAPK